MFLQVSFFHGIVEFKLRKKDPTGGGDYVSGASRAGHGPGQAADPAADQRRGGGAAARGLRPRLGTPRHRDQRARAPGCASPGTMSDYAAIVNRKTGRAKLFTGPAKFLKGRTYSKPYWATTSQVDGNCWVSMAGSDLVLVIDYGKRKVIDEIAVGEHPQRVRDGLVSRRVLTAWAAGGASSEPDLSPVPIAAAQTGRGDRRGWPPDRGDQLRPRRAVRGLRRWDACRGWRSSSCARGACDRSCPWMSSWIANGQSATEGDPVRIETSEPLGVDDHPGDLAGADRLAVADVPGGDGEPVQPAVDVRRGRGHLDLLRRPGWRRGARARRGCRRWSSPRPARPRCAAQVAASHQASSRGVPSTGRLPEPDRDSRVLVGDRERQAVARVPLMAARSRW